FFKNSDYNSSFLHMINGRREEFSLPKRINKENFSDFTNVEKNKKQIMTEDLPEGAYGSPFEGTFMKTSPWEEGQRSISPYTYENKELHKNFPRKMPDAEPTDDDQD